MEIALDLLSRVRGNTYMAVSVAVLSLFVFFYFNYSTWLHPHHSQGGDRHGPHGERGLEEDDAVRDEADGQLLEGDATDEPPAMNRYVKETTVLSDGTRLPKGSLLAVSLAGLRDASHPAFERKRQEPGQENQWQPTSTRNEFPRSGTASGRARVRFLVGNDIRIFLAELLMRYNVGYPEGVARPPCTWFAAESRVNMDTPLAFKLREKA
ncbi:hypothetical protein LZ30DRAFT_786643 [Colletotrichum cereale]|nr:hypothetical protein LZ30DRAFT_786643 [Colletotrichum cereale]